MMINKDIPVLEYSNTFSIPVLLFHIYGNFKALLQDYKF